VVSLVAPLAPPSSELWLFPRLSSGVGAACADPNGVVVVCVFISLSLPASRPCLGFGLSWLVLAPAALEEVFGSWRGSCCLPSMCHRGMGAGSGFTLASASSVDVGAIRPNLSAVGPLELSRKLLSGLFVLSPSAVSLSLDVTSSFCVLSISS